MVINILCPPGPQYNLICNNRSKQPGLDYISSPVIFQLQVCLFPEALELKKVKRHVQNRLIQRNKRFMLKAVCFRDGWTHKTGVITLQWERTKRQRNPTRTPNIPILSKLSLLYISRVYKKLIYECKNEQLV